MRYSEAQQGRVFIIRLEDGEIIHETIEKFAKEKNIKAAMLTILGGGDKESKLVVGPEDGDATQIKPMLYILDDVHEVVGTGTLFTNKSGNPTLHMHISCGRNDRAKTGCIRQGVKVWQLMEVIMIELINSTALRVYEPKLGYELLSP